MQINPYGEDPVRLAVSLVNDRPRTVADLRVRCARMGLSGCSRVTTEDLIHTLRLLDEWTQMLDAPDEPTRVARLNAMMATYTDHPRITDHAGTGWHIHFRADRRSVGRRLAVIIAAGTAFHLVNRGMQRLGRCRASDCERVYADVSRNGTQRYCSVRCANRDAVRRHRSRASAVPSPGRASPTAIRPAQTRRLPPRPRR